ncbi:MAG: hypothetical protein HOE69_00760 [Euryarchaeota archaeon]|nr:hypothetical protein [Euryarchaeota archaeon]
MFSQRQLTKNNFGQVHVLEMLTLFWLFFMSATFILQLEVPDPVSSSSDGQLQIAAEDAFIQQMGVSAVDSLNHSNQLSESLAVGDLDSTCNDLLAGLPDPVQGNCWVAKNEGDIARYGQGSTPDGRTISTHRLVTDGGDVWTVSLQVWYVGGGA